MPFYSSDTCDEVRAGNDIVDVISGQVSLERKGNRYFGLCPFHNEKHGSFCVFPNDQLFHCFGCGESGNVISFVMKYENIGFTDAVEYLAERAGIAIKSESLGKTSADFKKKQGALYDVNKAAAEYYFRMLRSPEGAKGLEYFRNRRLTKDMLYSFGLGFTGQGGGKLHEHLSSLGFSDEIQKDAGLIIFDEKKGARDRFFNRVIFPIMNQYGKVIAFGARVMGEGQPKYLNSAESDIFKKKETLYGLFAAKKTKRPEFILCEGYMDVISAHMAGFDSAVATLGTALTEEHAKVISRFKKPVYLCYDSDEAGRKAAIRGYEILKRANILVKIIDLAPYKDPDELILEKGREEFEKRINAADNALIVIKKWEYAGIHVNDPDELSNFQNGIAREISSYKDEIQRENYIQRFSRDFNIDEDILRRKVNNMGAESYVPTKKTVEKSKKSSGINPENALRMNEARLLYYLTKPDFYNKCHALVEKEDFLYDTHRFLYEKILDKMEKSEEIIPADLISIIEDESEASFISGIFCDTPETESEVGGSELKRTVLERVKKASVKRQDVNRDIRDAVAIKEMMEINQELFDEIKKIKF